MNRHTLTAPTPIDSLNILQLNTRRSNAVVQSLLNDPLTLSFHFLLVQEPYIYPHSNLPVTHSAWTPFYPDTTTFPPAASPEDTTIKSMIYVNKHVPTTSLATMPTLSNCITSIQYTLARHTFTVVSAYAPPKQSHKLQPLRQLLQHNPPSRTHHVLIGMDSNVHHPLWNPAAYSHTHREAEALIQLMQESGLCLQSQCGVPTFYPPHLDHANTTIDLMWVSPACADWVTSCVTDVSHTHSHLSDHAAILTRIDTPTPIELTQKHFRNWRTLDSPTFKTDLNTSLATLLPTLDHPALDQASLDHHANLLTHAVTAAMDIHVPRTPLSARAKRWWNKPVLNPLKLTAQRLRRRYQRQRTTETKKAYIEAAQQYQTAIHGEKRQHWQLFLNSLTPTTLFTAALYATTEWTAPSLAVPPLRNQDGLLTSVPEEQADLLFLGTSAPTIPCILDDILPLRPPADNPSPFTAADVKSVIDRLHPDKAPGKDEISNRAIKAGGLSLARALCALANLCLRSTLFPSAWKVAKTVILRKPHKPDYSNPTAYRPIALLSCLGKVVEAVIADRFKHYAEVSNILPPGHYGGRPQRSTDDALTHFTAWTKSQWAKGRFVEALFVDVKAAFPTVNPTCLANTLRCQGFCPSLIRLISSYLSQRSTTIAFGDYESEPKPLTIGLPQGSMLSVILYIL